MNPVLVGTLFGFGMGIGVTLLIVTSLFEVHLRKIGALK